MNVTLPNGAVIQGVPDDATKEQIKAKAIAAGLATPADFGDREIPQSKPEPQQSKTAQEKQIATPGIRKNIGIGEAIGAGFERGVKQSLGGAANKILDASSSIENNSIDELVAKMQSGEIPATQENIDKLDRMQERAVKLSQTKKFRQDQEKSERAAYEPIQEARPIYSAVGNIGGQLAGLPLPGVGSAGALTGLSRYATRIGEGAVQGAISGYVQPTIEGESSADNAFSSALIGGAAPAVLSPLSGLAGSAYRGAVGRPSDEVASAIDYARQNDLPLMTTDVVPPTTFAGKGVRSLAEKIPLVGTAGGRSAQQNSRIEEIKKVSESYGLPNENEIVASLKRKSDKLSAAAGKRYQATIESMGEDPIPLNNTVRVIDEQIEKYTKPGAAQNPGVVKALQDFKSQVTSGDNNLQLLRQNRTLFRELIKGEDGIISDSGKQANEAVYRAITADMQSGVEGKLGPQAAAALKQVDGIWAREAEQLKKTKLKNIFSKGEIKPEEATKMLFSNDKTEAETLFNALDTQGRQNAKAAIINRAFEKSAESPERFINEMNRLKNQSQVFFRGKERRQIDGLINYLDYTREASAASVTTKTGQEALQIGVPAGVFADLATTGGAGTAGFATLGAAARVYESEPVRNLLSRMSSLEPGSTQFEKAAREFEKQISRAAARSSGAREGNQ